MSSVCPHVSRAAACIQIELQTPCREFIIKLAACLCCKCSHIKLIHLHLDIAGACLRCFNQVLRQVFKPCRLLVEYVYIFLNPVIINIFPLDKVNIVDNRRKRSLDVM